MDSCDRATARRRRPARAGIAVVIVAVMALLSGCKSGSASASGATEPSGSASPSAAAAPTVTLDGQSSSLSYQKPVTIKVADGSFTSLQVATDSDQILEGDIAPDGSSWVSQTAPRPASSYTAKAVIKDASGQSVSQTVTFKVASVPDNHRISFSVTPDGGTTVGIGQPIVVHFLTAVTQKADVERALTVDATTPSGGSVEGSWSWLNGQEVDWRPKNFWTPGTKVKLDMKIAGVKAASGRYGRKDYSESFTIGASHITRVDAKTDRLKVYQDGKLMHTWATGTGRRGLETYSGTYIVLGKSAEVEMDSCSARITCDKKNPDYYDEKEKWATRLTASGTFVHAASWDGNLGQANTSHGCIHLADANAKTFYNAAVPGDIVIVTNTGRGPQQRIATQDPGLYDWNLSWTKWKAGSAL